MNSHHILRSYREALSLIERKALAGDEATMALLAPAAVLLRDAIDRLQEEMQ